MIFVSPYYQSLWGNHIHPGYWIRVDESKENRRNSSSWSTRRSWRISRPVRGARYRLWVRWAAAFTWTQKSTRTRPASQSYQVQVEMARKAATAETLGARSCLWTPSPRFPSRLTYFGLSSPSTTIRYRSFFANCRAVSEKRRIFDLTDWFKKPAPFPCPEQIY